MRDAQPLLINTTAEGLVAPDRAAPGRATFRAESTLDGAGWIGLARLAAGTGWPQLREAVRDTVSDDQARIVKGMAALDTDADLLGGAVVHPSSPGEFTIDLVPGSYVFFDYPDTASDNPNPRHQLMTVAGAPTTAEERRAAAGIRAVLSPAGPRFEVAGTLTAGRPMFFENAMARPGLSEFVVFAVPDEVGQPELDAFFGAFVDGSPEWPPNPPFDLASGFGSLPLTAGARSVMRVPATARRDVVVNWLKDATDGVRMAKRGQYRLVEFS